MTIQVPVGVGTSGQLVDAVVSGSTVQRQVMTLGDPTSTSALAPVTTTGGILVAVSNPSTAVTVSNISTAVTVTNPSTAVTITNPTTAVSLTSAIALSSGLITFSSVPTVTATGPTTVTSGLISVTSGTITSTAATNPWSSAPGFNVPIVNASSGNVGVFPSTGTLLSVFTFNASSSNSLTNITTAAAIFHGWNVGNQTTSAAASIKAYNSTTATVGSTTNLLVTIPIPGGSAGGGNNFYQDQGVSFTGGITLVVTGNFAATSTGTTHAAGDIVGTFYYRT